MAKRMLIDAAHPEETRVVVLNGNRLEEFDFETSTKKQIKGNIYLAKITRVEPSLQAAFVEYGGNRHGFLAFSEIHSDYYRIPVSDRRAASAADEITESEPEDHHSGAEGREPESGEVNGEGRKVHQWQGSDDRPPQAHGEAREGSADDTERSESHAEQPNEHRGYAQEDGEHSEDHDYHSDEPGAPSEEHNYRSDDQGDHQEERGDQQAERGTAGENEPDRGDTIETLGGDEIEEATRQRARPFRHYKIQEVIKRRQIMLVQVTKEERGNKGAALTTYLSLAGRYCVLMPNTPRGGGVSRKITNAADRRRLKELVGDLDMPEGMGVIVRTAGSERSKAEIKRDFEYLIRLWDEIRELTLKSTAPALIYEEGNLIKRSIRDLYSRDLEEVIVDGEEGYRTAKAFMKMLMPSHAKRVKPYRDPTIPLFHRFQVESQIDAIHSPVVQLRSGGYIVINPTEALVAIDVNSGRSTKERNIEETAHKTNQEAAEEIARQLRLRDLAGLIVIDFIDMEETRNQNSVERRLKDAMRYDRARIQLGRISPFGLLELSRQRLRPSLLEASTQPCPHCNGSGHIRSTESTALHVLRAIEEEGMRRRSAEISVAVPTLVALYILNQKRDALAHAELRYGFRVAVTNDDTLIPPAFRLERLRALTPAEVAALPPAVTQLPDLEDEDDRVGEEEDEEVEVEERQEEEKAEAEAERSEDGEDGQRRRRRRRRRRREDGREDGRERGEESPEAVAAAPADHAPAGVAEAPIVEDAAEEGEGEDQPAEAQAGDSEANRKRRRRGRRGGRRRRRGNGPEGLPETEDGAAGPAEEHRPSAEVIELVAEPPPAENAAVAMEEALASPSALIEAETGTESVPVIESSDAAPLATPAVAEPPAAVEPDAAAAEPAPQPAPAPVEVHPPAPEPAPAPEPSAREAERPAQHDGPAAHDVTGHPSNPKRGWWSRMLS